MTDTTYKLMIIPDPLKLIRSFLAKKMILFINRNTL